MATTTMQISISVAWWVQPYLGAVNLFENMTGMSPDVDKCVAFAMRGVKLRMIE